VGTVKTYADDDNNNVVGDVQELDGGDDFIQNTPLEEDEDESVSNPNRHSDMR